mmetsp:Transcript_9410/g.30706  ORF Transcript_9410/g.30706 Transcript_9410/m.30706 type:complete len:297 (+) Transcript_9410:427-1317(+)
MSELRLPPAALRRDLRGTYGPRLRVVLVVQAVLPRAGRRRLRRQGLQGDPGALYLPRRRVLPLARLVPVPAMHRAARRTEPADDLRRPTPAPYGRLASESLRHVLHLHRPGRPLPGSFLLPGPELFVGRPVHARRQLLEQNSIHGQQALLQTLRTPHAGPPPASPQTQGRARRRRRRRRRLRGGLDQAGRRRLVVPHHREDQKPRLRQRRSGRRRCTSGPGRRLRGFAKALRAGPRRRRHRLRARLREGDALQRTDRHRRGLPQVRRTGDRPLPRRRQAHWPQVRKSPPRPSLVPR